MTTSLFETLIECGEAYHEDNDIIVSRHYWTNPYARGDFYRVFYAVHTERPSADMFSTFGEVTRVVDSENGWRAVERMKGI